MRQELTSNEKIVEAILVFVLGILLPALSLFLAFNACPSIDDSTFALPFANAGCPGDLMGQIGLCIFGIPFTITFALALIIEALVLGSNNSGGGILLFGLPYLLASFVNGLLYWLMIRSVFYIYQKMKTRVNLRKIE